MRKKTRGVGVREPKSIARLFDEGTPIDEALAQAGRDAVRRHREAGLKIPVFRHGRTVWIRPASIDKAG